MTFEQIAARTGRSVRTVPRWREAHSDFPEAVMAKYGCYNFDDRKMLAWLKRHKAKAR